MKRSAAPAARHMHGAVAHLDFLLGLFEIAGVGISRQILVRPGVGADGHSGFDHLLGDLGMPHRVLADLKERGFQTIVGERLEHGGGILRPRTVVERQHDLLLVEEVILLEMLEAEAGAAGGVDLDDARQAHAAGLVACRNVARRRGGRHGGFVCSRCVWRRSGRCAAFCAGVVWARRVGAAGADCGMRCGSGIFGAGAWAIWLTGARTGRVGSFCANEARRVVKVVVA